MFCRECWEKIPDGSEVCPACGKPPAGTVSAPTELPPSRFDTAPVQVVPNYLVQSILVTVACCLPAGIAAIVYASQANSRQAAGDYAGALQAGNKAKMWCWISLGAGLVVIALYAVIFALGSSSGTGDL